MAVTNGRIPAKNLTRSVVGVDLVSSAAKSADRLAAEFRKEMGYDLRATDGYRAIEGQKEIFLSRYRRAYIEYAPGRVDRRVWNGVAYYRKPGTAAAAVPGASNHGLGVAVDFASGVNTSFSSPAYVWMTKNAPKHGWSNAEGRAVSEPWHWVHNKARDTRPAPVVATKPAPAPTTAPPARTQEDTTMHIIRKGVSTETFVYRLITGGRAVEISRAAASALKGDGIPVTALPNVDFDRIAKELAR